jgi:Fe-S-cluster containining protein
MSTERQFEQLMPDSCDGCGLCCQGIGSPVLLYQSRPAWEEEHPYRPDDLPEALVQEIDAHFAGLFRGQEPLALCLWYDEETRRCRHYEWRPQVCRDYELAGPACLDLRHPFVDLCE